MTNQQLAKIEKAIMALAGSRRAELTELTLAAYVDALADLGVGEVRDAIRVLVREPGRWLPSAGDLRAFVLQRRQPRRSRALVYADILEEWRGRDYSEAELDQELARRLNTQA